METPLELITNRYGDVFLSKSRNLKIVSGDRERKTENSFIEYNALLGTGSLNPVVITALVKNAGPDGGDLLSRLNWSSLHVRSYRSWDELVGVGIALKDTEAQKPTVQSSRKVKDFNMRFVSETENSKTYQFTNNEEGKVTLFTSKPVINVGGNDLPRNITLVAAMGDNNFVFERA